MFDPSFGLTLWQTLVGALVVASLLAVLTRRWHLAAVVLALLADWTLCTFVPDFTDHVWNWAAWGITDLLVGLVVVVLVADNVVSMAIAFLLLCEVGAHLAFGMNHLFAGPPDRTAQFLYWTFTHWGAWLQVWLLAFWIGGDAAQMAGLGGVGDGVRRFRLRFRRKGVFASETTETGE